MRVSTLFLLVALAACSSKEPTYPPATPPYLTIFLIDGLNQETLMEELKRGTVPNLKALRDEGLFVPSGVTAFPSMTGYAFYPFLTGREAATSGVMGLRYLQRDKDVGAFRYYVGGTNKFMNGDLRPDVPTLFERFPNELSITYDTYVNRGAKEKNLGGITFAMAKYYEHWWVPQALRAIPFVGDSLSPDWSAKTTASMDQLIEDLPRQPKIHWIVFNSVDAYAHIFGPSKEGYRKTLHNVDREIGRYRAESRRLGQEDKRIYLVLSDHGLTDVQTNVDLVAPLKAAGVSLFRGEAMHLFKDALDEPFSHYDDYHGLYVINGNGLVYYYLKRPGATSFRPPLRESELRTYAGTNGTVDVVKTTLAQPGIDFVLARGNEPKTAVVIGKQGRGVLREEAGKLRYDVEGLDPLGYAPELTGQPFTDAEWLQRSHTARYPDAPVQIFRALEAQDAGDLIVIAEDGYDLAPNYEFVVDNYDGAHGGLTEKHMRVPFVLTGPGVPRGKVVPTARVEDIGMTIHQLLGVPVEPCDVCGKSLLP